MLRQVLIFPALSAVLATGSAAEPGAGQAGKMAESLCPFLQPGDLVFKGASTALWTEMAAAWSDERDRRWGHVGLVLGVRNQSDSRPVPGRKNAGCAVRIVHADTGTGDPHRTPEPGHEIGAVRTVSLEAFLGDVDHAGVFRLDISPPERVTMLAWAANEADNQTPFDRGYNLASENNLYCTELVWRAMSEALGHDAIPDKSTRMGRTYIALSDLSLHPLASEVMEINAHP